MSFDTSIAENIRKQVEAVIEFVSGESEQTETAYEVEARLWREMLVMGQHLMQLFFNKQKCGNCSSCREK